MFQTVQGRKVYVVDLPELPTLPVHAGTEPELANYAKALTHAIENGIIMQPGKYAIEIYGPTSEQYNIFAVI